VVADEHVVEVVEGDDDLAAGGLGRVTVRPSQRKLKVGAVYSAMLKPL
jgi:hypothetical protein